MQIQAAHVEGELCAQHAEEADNVVSGLCERVGDEIYSLPTQLLQRLKAALIPLRNVEAVARAAKRRKPLGPALFTRSSQHVARAFGSGPQLGADQHAARKLELTQMRLDHREIIVTQLVGQHREQPAKALRVEALL